MITSFGFRHGAPSTKQIFDVRDLSHDERDPAFAAKEQEIRAWITAHPGQDCAIGCEQGKHRSVVLADRMADRFPIGVYHRDHMKPRRGTMVGSGERG